MMGKTTAATRLQNTLWGRRLQQWKHKGNDLLHFSLRHTRRLQWRQLPLSLSLYLCLSLSLTLSLHTRYTTNFTKCNNNHTQNVCPKSYLYIYDFRVIYISVPSNRSDGSEPDLRSSGCPQLPSGGTWFPTNLTKSGAGTSILLQSGGRTGRSRH